MTHYETAVPLQFDLRPRDTASDEDDNLRGARGVATGVLIGAGLWAFTGFVFEAVALVMGAFQ